MRHLLLTILLLAAPASQAQPRQSARDLVARGTALMSQNKVEAAIASYTRAIELNPRYAEAYVRRGMARRAAGDLAGSIEDYEKAAAIEPKATANNRFVAESYSNRGYNRLNALNVEGAIEDFTKAIATFPNEGDHYYKRGRARLINEDFAGAVADLDKALGMSRRGDTFLRTLIYANRGMARLLGGDEAGARSDFDESHKLNKGVRLHLESHLRELELLIMLMRERRAEQQKGVS